MLTASAGRLRDAADIYSMALAARVEALGDEHRDTLKTMVNLGLVHLQVRGDCPRVSEIAPGCF